MDSPIRDGVLHRAGFIHRENLQGHRHDVEVQQSGNEVVLIFDPGSSDEGCFVGTLIDDHTLRGTYTNPSRGESHNLDLIASTAVTEEISPIHARGRSALGSSAGLPIRIPDFATRFPQQL